MILILESEKTHMCEYMKRMSAQDTPTDDIRLWSGFAHSVVEYTGPKPFGMDGNVYLWLHEKSATQLLDMCDELDAKFSDLKAENEQLRNERDHLRHLLGVVAEEHHDMQERNGKLQNLVNQYARIWFGKMVEVEQLQQVMQATIRREPDNDEVLKLHERMISVLKQFESLSNNPINDSDKVPLIAEALEIIEDAVKL